jgi:hypothetical protein
VPTNQSGALGVMVTFCDSRSALKGSAVQCSALEGRQLIARVHWRESAAVKCLISFCQTGTYVNWY